MRNVKEIKAEIAKLEAELKKIEKPKTKREIAAERALRAAEWACNPESETYWSM